MVKDLSDLGGDDGWAPDAPARYGAIGAQHWFNERQMTDGGFREQVADTPFRGSDAGGCLRQAEYKMNEVERTNPVDAAGAYRMQLGTLMHEEMEPRIKAMLIELGLVVTLEPTYEIEGVVSGRGDLAWEDPDSGYSGLVEIKTVGGYAFKLQCAWFNGPPMGPKPMHVRQSALAAKQRDHDELTITYLGTELISPKLLSQMQARSPVPLTEYERFTADFTLTRAQFLPIADHELRRMELAIKAKEKGVAIPRIILPDDDPLSTRTATVTDPKSGAWEIRDGDRMLDAGEYWLCRYCDWHDHCQSVD